MMRIPATQPECAALFCQLRDRSGLSWAEISQACGYTYQSGIQRYYEPDYIGNAKPYLPMKIIDGLFKIMRGRGNPPISTADILALAPGGRYLPFLLDSHRENAALIEMSHELLAALEISVDIRKNGEGVSFEAVKAFIEKAEKLIAKAKGGAA